MEHVPRAARLVAGVEFAVARDALDPLFQVFKIIRNRSIRGGVLADAGRTAIVIESLCTSMPREIIERTAQQEQARSTQQQYVMTWVGLREMRQCEIRRRWLS